MMTHDLSFSVNELIPYINWIYFFHAWRVKGKQAEELRKEADSLLREWNARTMAIKFRIGLFQANSHNEDIIVNSDGKTCTIPLLRQQSPPFLCLADFIPPVGMEAGTLGVFASTVVYETDGLLEQTLADRLAEAAAERGHEITRKRLWGYAPDENLTPDEMFKERYLGKRPAVGYPSLPDQSLIFVLSELIDLKSFGIGLTDTGAMIPHASTSGLMFSLKQATHFAIGPISEEQLADYAKRRRVPPDNLRPFLNVT